ncbi:hypothetical protein WwAna1251 [Wolbachia endosymbiont of Drosophila ananassae]|nr:hypothetical protein WwAna1251 [Wolbachia endosymbiont of Drosophila ananassae]
MKEESQDRVDAFFDAKITIRKRDCATPFYPLF